MGRAIVIGIAQVNLTSARRAVHARGTAAHTEAETAHYEAVRRFGELDRHREDLQAEARTLRPADDR